MLAGGLGALGEHEHELLFVVQQPVRVVGVRGDATAARPERADDRQRAEEVLGEPVHRAPSSVSMPCMIDGASDGMAPRVVGDEQRAAVVRDVLEPFPLGAEPVR